MNDEMNQLQQLKMQCQQNINQPVHLQVHGQTGYNGVIEHVDDEHVYLLIPVDEQGQYMDFSDSMMRQDERAPYYHPYYPSPYYGGYQPYGYGYSPYGYQQPFRWDRLVLPLTALTALAVLF